jgi:uncharacterized membrane protein (DUF485 family)
LQLPGSLKTRCHQEGFISPVFVFILVYYFTLRAMVGLAPRFMHTSMFQGPNLVCMFALSQFFAAWFVAWRYLKAAGDIGRAGKQGLCGTEVFDADR